mmetsp:Transcript_63490/g.182266  ORF Transcript_63490/g.182266 Transcript_63490/m.182266 type:complete len:300 (+) Transcript_63490:93-992(+)
MALSATILGRTSNLVVLEQGQARLEVRALGDVRGHAAQAALPVFEILANLGHRAISHGQRQLVVHRRGHGLLAPHVHAPHPGIAGGHPCALRAGVPGGVGGLAVVLAAERAAGHARDALLLGLTGHPRGMLRRGAELDCPLPRALAVDVAVRGVPEAHVVVLRVPLERTAEASEGAVEFPHFRRADRCVGRVDESGCGQRPADEHRVALRVPQVVQVRGDGLPKAVVGRRVGGAAVKPPDAPQHIVALADVGDLRLQFPHLELVEVTCDRWLTTILQPIVVQRPHAVGVGSHGAWASAC